MGAPQLDASIATLAIIVSAVCDFIADSCSAICIWFGHLYQLTWHEIPWNDLFSVDVQRHGTCNDCCWDKALDGHDTHDAFTRKEITLSNAIYSGNNWWVYSVEPWEIRSSHMYASNGSIESGQGRQPISKNSLNVQMMEMWKREWERQQSAYKTLDKPIDVHLANGTKVLARQGLTSPLSFAKGIYIDTLIFTPSRILMET